MREVLIVCVCSWWRTSSGPKTALSSKEATVAAGQNCPQSSGLDEPAGEKRQTERSAQSQETHCSEEGEWSKLFTRQTQLPVSDAGLLTVSLSLHLQVILKEREERKQRRLLEEMGLLPEQELQLDDQPPSNVADATGEKQHREGPRTLGERWRECANDVPAMFFYPHKAQTQTCV